MTNEQNAALEALEKLAAMKEGDSFTTNWVGVARTLKAMVEEPRLPEEPTAGAVCALSRGWFDAPEGTNAFDAAYRALYAHLTQPRTKTVEVWRVEWAQLQITGNWLPESSGAILHRDVAESIAEDKRRSEKRQNMACIRVTGPHKQEVPA